jgi:hypothetical protein
MKINWATFFLVLATSLNTIWANPLENDRLLAQIDLATLKQAAAQLPQLLGNSGPSDPNDNGDQVQKFKKI